jgi:tetratricopeptide (TPR) repeat protein
MANVAALKKKAADFEQKKQLDKAIAAYREVLDAFDAGGEANVDVGLYNRVGDLLVRQGNTPDAVTLYERAVDLYAEGGFFNNAIALCNKILRTSPGRSTVYYKLGKISAAKGFKADAKQNFLEYADRMQKAGRMEEAFRALKEFADLVPDQDDIRQMLAEQLTKADKKPEAIEQLQLLYARYSSDGREAEAEATAERMRAIDPTAVPKTDGTVRAAAKNDDLIFIDLDAPARRTRQTRAVTAAEQPIVPVESAPAAELTELTELAELAKPDAPEAPVVIEPPLAALEIESTAQVGSALIDMSDSSAMLGLEPTSLGEVPIELAPLPAADFAELDLTAIPEAPTAPRSSERSLALAGDLPLLDLSDAPHTAAPRRSVMDLEVFDDATISAATADLPMMDIETTVAADAVPMIDLGDATIDDLALIEPDALPPRISAELPSVSLPMIDLDHEIAVEEAREEAHVEELAAHQPVAPTTFDDVPIENVEVPPPVRRTTSILANSVGMLRVRLEDEPSNWTLHREFAEALLDDGERDEGLKELELTLAGFEKDGDLEAARSVADEIVRLNPASVRHHQKRVEYAFRANDKPRLANAYLELADALFREGQPGKAKVVYSRVLEIVPDDLRARAALDAYGDDLPAPASTPEPIQESGTGVRAKRYTGEINPPEVPEPAVAAAADDYVSLGDWLRDEEGPKNTRMVVEEEAPSGDEAADFADMLKKFKQGVADNVDEEDHESHYDLGVAFKEMGLLDEAISEFQKALRGTQHRVRTYEALGQCFLEKKQFQVAMTILQRAVNEPGVGDEQLVGVLYLLGYTCEALGRPADAKPFYERVFSVDIQFRDVGDRLNAVDKVRP